MEGTVRYGINNIYTVHHEETEYECTLKGKQLDTGEREYAALAPGDRVDFRSVSASHNQGVIDSRLPRKSSVARWNNKKNRVQVFAANVDLVVCVSAAQDPKFRRRFVDRILTTAEWFDLETIIVLNKTDLGVPEPAIEYLSWLDHLGYQVVYCTTHKADRVHKLESLLHDRKSVIVGHSGVGKSSLINMLAPGMSLPVKPISRKYHKGVHTTRFAQVIDLPDGGWIVDAPGIREVELVPEIRGSLDMQFREMRDLRENCMMPGCSHMHEPECAVTQAVENGELPEIRYESYCMLYESLEQRFQ